MSQSIGLQATLNTSNFESGVRRYLRGTDRMVDGSRNANREMGKMGNVSLGGATGAVGGLTTAVAAVGAAALAAATAVIGIGVASIQMAATFEQSMADVAASLGEELGDIGELSDYVLDLSIDPNLTVSAIEGAAAAEMLGKNGINMEEQLGGALKTVVELSNATGSDFKTSADIATDAMAIFGIEARNMGEVGDSIVGTLNRSKHSINSYKYAMANSAQDVKNYGMDIDDMNTALVATAYAFPSGMKQGTAFGAMINRLVAPTDKAKEKMAELGIKVFNTDETFKPLMETVEDFDKALYSHIDTLTQVGGLNKDQTEELEDWERQLESNRKTITAWAENTSMAAISSTAEEREMKEIRLQIQKDNIEANIARLEAIESTGKVVKGTRTLTEAEREHAKEIIFGAEAKEFYNAISGKTLVSMEKLKNQVSQEGQAAMAAATKTDTLSASWKNFKDILEAAKIVVGSPFLTILKDKLNGINDAMAFYLGSLRDVGAGGLAIALGLNAETVGIVNQVADAFDQGLVPAMSKFYDLVLSDASLDDITHGIIETLLNPKLNEQVSQAGLVTGQTFGIIFKDYLFNSDFIKPLIEGMARCLITSFVAISTIGATFVANIIAGIVEAMGGGKYKVMAIDEFIALAIDIGNALDKAIIYLAGPEFATKVFDAMTGVFDDIYDYLVGHSVVPDTVNEILAWWDLLVEGTASRLGSLFDAMPEMPDFGIGDTVNEILAWWDLLVEGTEERLGSLFDAMPEMLDFGFGDMMPEMPDLGMLSEMFTTESLTIVNTTLLSFLEILPNVNIAFGDLSTALSNLANTITMMTLPSVSLLIGKIDTGLTPATIQLSRNTRLLTIDMLGLYNILLLVTEASRQAESASKRIKNAMKLEMEVVKELTGFYLALAAAIRDVATAIREVATAISEVAMARGLNSILTGGGEQEGAGFAGGGQFVVPSGYSNPSGGMPIRVHSGELVSILTRAQTQKWRSNRSSKHYNSKTVSNKSTANTYNLAVTSDRPVQSLERSFALMRAKG